MSMSKPAKQARMMGQSQVKRSESVSLPEHVLPGRAAEKTPDTSLESSTNGKDQALPNHPKGHKSRDLSDVWKTMDNQKFLRTTDTITLGDVWVQPVSVEITKSMYTTVTLLEIVTGVHIKTRETETQMSLDDLLKMLYLGDCLQADFQGLARVEFEDWLSEKVGEFVRVTKEVEDSDNRSKLCQFILTQDPNYSLYPKCFSSHVGAFFRKSCCHSYKTQPKDVVKLNNPSMIKCTPGGRAKFEYVIEGRFIPLPSEWWGAVGAPGDGVPPPDSQPIDL